MRALAIERLMAVLPLLVFVLTVFCVIQLLDYFLKMRLKFFVHNNTEMLHADKTKISIGEAAYAAFRFLAGGISIAIFCICIPAVYYIGALLIAVLLG